jgi:glucose-1-phosphate cytidylyltransferase
VIVGSAIGTPFSAGRTEVADPPVRGKAFTPFSTAGGTFRPRYCSLGGPARRDVREAYHPLHRIGASRARTEAAHNPALGVGELRAQIRLARGPAPLRDTLPHRSAAAPASLSLRSFKMKVVLFCGGLGMRIRDYSENVPKPMIPVGHQPILWHVMQYYSQYGHKDFVLCMGYKANIIKEFFLNYKPHAYADCVVSRWGGQVELINEPDEDWRIALIDTGIWRNIGERLWAVREHVRNEEMFLANYSDGLTNADLDDMIAKFRKSGKLACFLAIRPPLTYHMADIGDDGTVRCFRSSQQSEIWINGGYFIFRPEIFDYMREGEELVMAPFERLIEQDALMAYKYEGFWRAMDSLRDRQVLEDMIEKGEMPWRVNGSGAMRPQLAYART